MQGQVRRFGLTVLFVLLLCQPCLGLDRNPEVAWDLDPQNESSLTMEPIRETAVTEDGLRLGIKHFARPGASPILMIHGVATNDRQWDTSNPRSMSFGRFLHSLGYDVWIGNFRGFGTQGFRSQAPQNSDRWTIEDYAAYDLPALIDLVQHKTQQAPWLICHSLGAYVIEGYLAGLRFNDLRQIQTPATLSNLHQASVKGVIFISGAHNLWWPKNFANIERDPVLNIQDYFRSNYELEMIAGFQPIYSLWPSTWSLPLSKIQWLTQLSLDQIPWIGAQIKEIYEGILDEAMGNPVMNAFYHVSNTHLAALRSFFSDGMEDIPFKVLEQFGNVIQNHKTQSYYHLEPNGNTYSYASIRSHIHLPVLFAVGDHDRLTNVDMVYRDGYLAYGSTDKTWLVVPQSGHFDVISGVNSIRDLMIPVGNWLALRRLR